MKTVTFMSVLLIVAIVLLHSFIALYIDRTNRIKGNSGTNWGLIPLVNVYLLGELLFNKLTGAILFIGAFLSIDWHITLFGTKYGFTLLPIDYRITLLIIMIITVICLVVYAAVIYAKVAKDTNNYDDNGKDLIFFIKETLWILVLVLVLYILYFIIKKYSVY